MVLALSLAVSPARAAEWRDVFAGVRDTAVFLMERGELVRAPFHLASRDTLWVPEAEQHVVSLRTSSRGGHVAWTTRAVDGDTTRLWLRTPAGRRLRLLYFAPRAAQLHATFSRPDAPSVEDETARGARLVRTNVQSRRQSLDALEWLTVPDRVVVGSDGGTAVVGDERGRPRLEGRVFPRALQALTPSPMLLVDGYVYAGTLVHTGRDGAPIRVTELANVDAAGRFDQFDLEHLFEWHQTRDEPQRMAFVAIPDSAGWRWLPVPGRREDLQWAAFDTTLWFVERDVIRRLTPSASQAVREAEVRSRVMWLGVAGGRLCWFSARGLECADPAAREPRLMWRPARGVQTVIPSRDGRSALAVSDDSLHVLGADGTLRTFARGRLEPREWFAAAGDRVLVAARPAVGSPVDLFELGAGAPRAVGMPRVPGGVLQPVGAGEWLLLHATGKHPPLTLHAYDVRARQWSAVRNPGIVAWEPEPRPE